MTQELEMYLETKSISWISPCLTSKNTLKMYAKCISKNCFKEAYINCFIYPLAYLKIFSLTHFAYIFNVFFDVKQGDLQLMLLVSMYVSSSEDDLNLGPKLVANKYKTIYK
jgi:hypothetical protein